MRTRCRTAAAVVAAACTLAALAPGCAGKKVAVVGVVDAERLFREAGEHLAKRDLRNARKKLEQIQISSENRERLEPLVRLMLADVTFFQAGDLAAIDARQLYRDFVTLYGDHPRAPYAQLQAGVSSLRLANHPSRDQTETLRAIEDLREVLRRYPDSQYARAARDKIREARSSLARHEFLIGRFYLNKKAYAAAAGRFKQVVERYPDYPEKDGLYFHLAQALLRGGNDVEARLYLDMLLSDYPEGEWTEAARKLLGEAESGAFQDAAP